MCKMVVGGHQEKARYFGERAKFHAGRVKTGGEDWRGRLAGCGLRVAVRFI